MQAILSGGYHDRKNERDGPEKERFFNPINLTADDPVYVGIDVHKKDYHIAVWLNNGIALTYVAPSDNPAMARQLQRLKPALRKIVYEADPTGFPLVRTLLAASLPAA